MLTCEFCGAENADLAKHCSACNEPLTAAAAMEDEKQIERASHDRLVKKEVFYGVGAAVLVALIGFGVYRNQQAKKVEATVRSFYTAYLAVDDGHIPQFWKCIVRGDQLPKDNLELERALEIAVQKSAGGYAKHARGKCLALLARAPAQLEGVTAPEMMAEAYPKYIEAVKQLQKEAEAYVAGVEALEAQRARDPVVKKLAANYHYAGNESADTFAYDKFLRCAVPGFAGLTEQQQVLDYLAGVYKDPVATVQKWRKDCYPGLEKTEGTTADADYKKKVEAFSTDDRDVEAFDSVIKAAYDTERKALHPPFIKAWFEFGQAKDALLAKFAEYMNR